MRILEVGAISNAAVLEQGAGTVLVLPQVTIVRRVPEQHTLAAALLPDPVDPQGRLVSVVYHVGRKAWQLCTEYMSIQKATDYRCGTLSSVLADFEALAGVPLPPIKVIEVGVGIYPAADLYASTNPWALQDGETYEFTRSGKTQRYLARVRHGRAEVSLVGWDHVDEYFDPALLFDAAAWDSMRLVAAEPDVPAPGARASCRPG